jgi:hypothetical protein
MVQWAIAAPILEVVDNFQKFSSQVKFKIQATSEGKDGLKAECYLPFEFILFSNDNLALWPTYQTIPNPVMSYSKL